MYDSGFKFSERKQNYDSRDNENNLPQWIFFQSHYQNCQTTGKRIRMTEIATNKCYGLCSNPFDRDQYTIHGGVMHMHKQC